MKWLLDNQYIVIVGTQVVFTKKVSEELKGLGFNTQITESIQLNVGSPGIVETLTPSTFTLADDKKAIWNRFIIDADIPHRVKSPDGGVYTVRQYSPGCAIKLMKIVKDPNINYKRLVESTKLYYKNVTYKALLSNYIDKEIWRSEYDAWDEQKPTPLQNGENRWED